MKYIKTFEQFINEGKDPYDSYSLLNFFQEMQSFAAAGVDKQDIKDASKPKNKKKNTFNTPGLADLMGDWMDGKYDEDPGYLVDELRDLLESEEVHEKSSGDNALLQKMYKALKRSKNFSSIKYGKPSYPDEWDGATITIMSKLKGEDEKHTDDFDEFEIGIEPDDGGIVLIYEPSGNDTEVESVADVLNLTRANEGYVSEGTTPTFKRLIKMAKANGIETVDELDDLIQDEFSDAEPHISGADYEIAKKKLRLNESSTLKTYDEFVNEGMSKSAIKKQIKIINKQLDDEEGGDGEPLTNETEAELQRELSRLEGLLESEEVTEAYTEAKLKKLLSTLGGEEEDDSAAYDIADGILYDEKGLEDYLRKKKGIKDPQSWLADHI